MNFSCWLEQNETLAVNFNKLYGWRPKIEEVVGDILAKRMSYSTGSPIRVSKLNSPRGSYFIIDGYHRVIEAMMRGEKSISAVIDNHIPNIERSGGAYNSYVSEKAPISIAIDMINNHSSAAS